MGKPSVYIFDCSQAGQIIESFKLFIRERESEFFLEKSTSLNTSHFAHFGLLDGSILLAACGPKEILPMNPKLPADLFTSCLTSPIKTALLWFCQQKVGKLVQNITEEMLDKIPGKLTDRKTPLGELNWIFTAITDTIAWNSLPQDLFQKLFRQDLLVASLFRNFLLAERIMHSYNCTPESHPLLPSTYQHPLWQAWDLVLDHIISQLPSLIDGTKEYEPSSFFPEQLNAFQVWLLSSPNPHEPPTQLPIILQFLLSQAHRLQALELLGRYLDMGPESVHAALSVGIFPYVLKLLASRLKELQPILVFIWAKILAVDKDCQSDLVKDGGYKYFISVLSDTSIQYEYRTMAAFILSAINNNYPKGQEVCLKGNVISICLSQLDEPNPVLKQWLAVCLGRLWQKYDAARWCGVRDSAHEKLAPLLWDEVPEVRAAAVFALGTYIFNSSSDGTHSNHATSIDHTVAIQLLPHINNGSPIVRMELVTALHGLVIQYDREFQIAALKCSDGDALVQANLCTSLAPGGWINVFIDDEAASLGSTPASDNRPAANKRSPLASGGTSNSVVSNGDSATSGSYSSEEESGNDDHTHPVRRFHDISSNRSVYAQIWRALQMICSDPCPSIAIKAGSIIKSVHDKVSSIMIVL
jgi:regulator-associated protein of mTOR